MGGAAKISYKTCIANFKDFGVVDLISFHEQYEKGIMPYAGGYMEQPSKFVEIMDLVHNLKSEYGSEKEALLKKYKR